MYTQSRIQVFVLGLCVLCVHNVCALSVCRMCGVRECRCLAFIPCLVFCSNFEVNIERRVCCLSLSVILQFSEKTFNYAGTLQRLPSVRTGTSGMRLESLVSYRCALLPEYQFMSSSLKRSRPKYA